MGLFDQPLKEILSYIEDKRGQGLARDYPFTPVLPYADSPQIILSEDTGLELGNPGLASRSLLLWDSNGSLEDGCITLVGPDFAETTASSLPFAQVIMVGGDFIDEYDCYRDLRDATYGLRLRGFMTRVFPGRQSIWCRINKDALDSGFNAQILGSSLIQSLKKLDFVEHAQVLFVTSSKEAVEELSEPADKVMDIVEALIKMYEEMNFDCESCEYVDVCDSVVELRQIRDKLQAEKDEKTTPDSKKGVDGT
jgi:CO dehydrogenase/acetyl-CoA synthase beta subunit